MEEEIEIRVKAVLSNKFPFEKLKINKREMKYLNELRDLYNDALQFYAYSDRNQNQKIQKLEAIKSDDLIMHVTELFYKYTKIKSQRILWNIEDILLGLIEDDCYEQNK